MGKENNGIKIIIKNKNKMYMNKILDLENGKKITK